MNESTIKAIQQILFPNNPEEWDGKWGPKSQAALDAIIQGASTGEWHNTTATSFADPEDLRRFNQCKTTGKTDEQCFAVGDNCIGIWKDPTGEGTGPCCALPIWAWHDFYGAAHRKKVIVQVNGKEAIVELKDSSGHRDVIDLNPDACELLQLRIPVKEPARWKWA